jgi:hypothetical protein
MTEIDSTRTVMADDPARPSVPLVDLDQITPDESLLADVRRTRITTPATRALLALVVVAAAFLGGALVERWQHKTSSATSAASVFSQLRAARGAGGGAAGGSGGAGSAGAFPGAGGTGGATFGTVKLVDGTNVYVQDAQGDTIKITTKPTTTVSVTKTGKVNDLEPGSTVIVQGTASSDGLSMAATSISQSAAGLGGGRFRATAGG